MNEILLKDWIRHSTNDLINELSPDDYIAKQAIDNAQKVYDFCIQKITESGINLS